MKAHSGELGGGLVQVGARGWLRLGEQELCLFQAVSLAFWRPEISCSNGRPDTQAWTVEKTGFPANFRHGQEEGGEDVSALWLSKVKKNLVKVCA